jgi:hypothetical protein
MADVLHSLDEAPVLATQTSALAAWESLINWQPWNFSIGIP